MHFTPSFFNTLLLHAQQGDRMQLNRLKMAIQYRQKKVSEKVSLTWCQQTNSLAHTNIEGIVVCITNFPPLYFMKERLGSRRVFTTKPLMNENISFSWFCNNWDNPWNLWKHRILMIQSVSQIVLLHISKD